MLLLKSLAILLAVPLGLLMWLFALGALFLVSRDDYKALLLRALL